MSLTPATTIYSNPAVKRQEPGDSNGGSVSNHFYNFCTHKMGRVFGYSPSPFLNLKIMEVTLSSSSVERIAQRVADIMLQRQTPDLCTTSEAAKILGISPAYLRRIADRYPHIKQGEGKQARLMFRKEGLL